jgi:hypothetical protein
MKAPLSLVALGLAAAPAAAQATLPFPLRPDGQDAETGVQRLATVPGAVDALVGRDAVVLTGVPLPSGSANVALTRIHHEALGFGYRVDGEPAFGLLDGAGLTIWKGSILGVPGSEVLLSFSHVGSRGWMHDGVELVHLLPQTDAVGSWVDGPVFQATEAELAQLGVQANLDCKTDELVDLRPFELDGTPVGGAKSGGAEGGTGVLYGCEIAVETDYQLNQVFGGSLPAETAYVTTLWAAVSDRYTEQLSTVLSFPYVQFYTSPADPWSTPGSGDSIAMLNEFVAAWAGAIPANADLGHFLSGANLGGGVAYLEVLCDFAHDFSFAVSGNIDGQVPFPIAVGPLNWDFMVTAHETGHNFGSPHTHDYSPPIDECAFGLCISDGTIMSYCHLCSGGLANITTFFHPLVVDVIDAHVSACLPVISGIVALPPTLVAPGAPTPLTADVAGTPVGSVDLNYRFDASAAFTAIPMSALGGGTYGADLPAAACGDAPEVFFSFTDSTVGPQSTETFALEVGNLTSLFHDDLEGDLGWTAGIAGDDATTGIWERGDPLGTSAQPSTGVAIGGGTNCYFTGQGSSGGSVGEADVDGGTTTLVSPVIDLSSGDARIGYWRWYSNTAGSEPGADVFVVEASNGGPWTNVETVGPGGPEAGGGWFYHEFTVSDVVTPTATVQVRFQASDLAGGSIIEAAVDELSVFRVDCDVCQADLGFAGPGSATIALCGPPLTLGSTATLEVTGGPAGQVGGIGYSGQFNPTPLLGGTLVPLPVGGIEPIVLDGAGSASLTIPGGAPFPVTLYLQGILLDASGQFLITNALAAELMP